MRNVGFLTIFRCCIPFSRHQLFKILLSILPFPWSILHEISSKYGTIQHETDNYTWHYSCSQTVVLTYMTFSFSPLQTQWHFHELPFEHESFTKVALSFQKKEKNKRYEWAIITPHYTNIRLTHLIIRSLSLYASGFYWNKKKSYTHT